MKRSDSCEADTDPHGVAYHVRLRRARESAGKSLEEMAASLGVPPSVYHEWEAFDGELTAVLSLGELANLSATLGIRTSAIFDDSLPVEPALTSERLCALIRAHLRKAGISLEEFENRVGFVIEPCLRDSSEVLKWDVDCLRFVCAEIGVDWLSALP